MTRLKTEWVEYMIDGMNEYNSSLKEKIGCNLGELVKKIYHVSDEEYKKAVEENKVAAVSITQGEGIINKFSNSVCAIIRSMGFDAEVESFTDVNGIYAGWKNKANIFIMADDDRYIAFDVKNGRLSDNNYATAYGYINVLRLLMEENGFNPDKEEILVIGYGIVGKEAVKILDNLGMKYVIADKDMKKLEELEDSRIERTANIGKYDYILDFTNEGDWISAADVSDNLLYASPGVPCSFNREDRKILQNKLVYDNLEIGTAFMIGQVLFDKGCGSD